MGIKQLKNTIRLLKAHENLAPIPTRRPMSAIACTLLQTITAATNKQFLDDTGFGWDPCYDYSLIGAMTTQPEALLEGAICRVAA